MFSAVQTESPIQFFEPHFKLDGVEDSQCHEWSQCESLIPSVSDITV